MTFQYDDSVNSRGGYDDGGVGGCEDGCGECAGDCGCNDDCGYDDGCACAGGDSCDSLGPACPLQPVTTFSFTSISPDTGKAQAGAVYTLASSSGSMAVVTSDSKGNVEFPFLMQGDYQLQEVLGACDCGEGGAVHDVTVDECGNVFVDGSSNFSGS